MGEFQAELIWKNSFEFKSAAANPRKFWNFYRDILMLREGKTKKVIDYENQNKI